MGTRNLTMVINQEGEKKVAQYGQWDGYPSGVGIGVLSILKNEELFNKLKSKLPIVRFLDREGVDKEMIESYNKNAPEWSSEPDNRTDQQKDWWSRFMTRDLAEEVLTNIANSNDKEIILADRESTGNSDGWVEYCYVIDLKENEFRIYHSIDKEPIKIYTLEDLPTDEKFLDDLEGSEEED